MTVRQERYDEKLIQILESACGIFADLGYHQASVRDVASATGVSPAGLYYYFRSKEELLFLILDHSLDSLLGEVRGAIEGLEDPEEKIRVVIRTHLIHSSRNSAEMRVVTREWEVLSGEFGRGIRRRLREYAALIIRTLRELRPESSKLDLRAAAMGLFGMLSWMYQWYEPPGGLTVEELADRFATIFLGGFLFGEQET